MEDLFAEFCIANATKHSTPSSYSFDLLSFEIHERSIFKEQITSYSDQTSNGRTYQHYQCYSVSNLYFLCSKNNQ